MPRGTDSASVTSKRKHIALVGNRSATYSRKKTAVACQVCRARRTKCGEERPCAFCVRTGAICTQEVVDSPSTGEDAREILDRLESLQSQVLDISTVVHALQGQSRPAQSLASKSPASTVTTQSRCNLSSINLEEVLTWQAFDIFEPPRPNPELHAAYHDPTSFDQTLSSSFTGELDTARCRNYLECFFRNVHIKNPVLDQDEVRRWYRSACVNGISWDAESCLVLLVMANGALSTDSLDEVTVDAAQEMGAARAFFSAAQKRIGALVMASPLLQTRCLFLSGVYLMTILRPFEAWRTFLQALAACQALNSLTTPHHDSASLNSDVGAEESIYWSCWKSEQELRSELRLSAGLPSSRLNLDHPLLYPSLPEGCSEHDTRAWYFYLGEISLWRQEMSARAEMQEALARDHYHGNDLSRLADLCSRLVESLGVWQESLPQSISLGTDETEVDVLRFVLQGRLSYSYELITWPFIHAAVQHSNTQPHVLEFVSLGLRTHFERLINNAPGFRYRHHGTWLMQRSSARSACILLVSAQHPQIAFLMPQGWALAVEKTIEMLDYWQSLFGQGGLLTDFMRRMLPM